MRNESYVFAFYLQANTELKEETLCKAHLQLLLSAFIAGTQGSYTRERKMEVLRVSYFSCCSLTSLILASLEKKG